MAGGREEPTTVEVAPPPGKRVRLTPRASPMLKATRKFRFGEFSIGVGSFTIAVSELSNLEVPVEIMEPFDGWEDTWDILEDLQFEEAKKEASSVDHGHFAPPCHDFFTRQSQQSLSYSCLEGSGQTCEAANKMVERMLCLIWTFLQKGGTISLENPW